MRMYGVLGIFLAIILSIHGQQQKQTFQPPMRNMLSGGFKPPLQSPALPRIPFPQCLTTPTAGNVLNSNTLAAIFQAKLQQEDSKLKDERAHNDNLNNNDIIEFPALQLRSDKHNGALVARTATKVSEEILNQLGCERNASVTAQIDQFLQTVPIPQEFCVFRSNIDCNAFVHYRTLSGVCNNLQRPYDGAAQTAFARLLPATYEDGISKPRSQSVLGGPLPACRQVSLSMGSKPVFDTSFNNLFVSYGQFIVHDITFAMPVSDSGRTPISSCTCDTQDPDRCLVVKVPADDPFMSRQRCMATPATAQGFTNQICALGVKDQLNGDSHYLDLSTIYGSTMVEGRNLRRNTHGLLKSTKKSWSKFDLPPGQVESKTCSDGTPGHRCFAGGDSRLMENIILSGLQAQWVRLHNVFSEELEKIRPDWNKNDDVLYEEAKKILSALHQRYIYEDWIPILIGPDATRKFLNDNGVFSRYDPNVRGVVYNEIATAALRLHTLARDLYSRCRPNGEFIDQIWLTDVAAKCKLAYDAQNNGLDSFLCGSLYDYGFAGDTNYAQLIHHRLFESTDSKGEIKRNDLVAINICRGREHGLQGYNAYRQLCGLRRANQFADFADSMTSEAVQKLQSIYQHPDDVDLFVGVNHENHVPGGLVGPVQACLIGFQFYNLKYGDRFFYKHEGEFTREQLNSIEKYTYNCFICHSTDIEKVPMHAFRPPNSETNPLVPCSQCPTFDFNPWR